MPHGLGLGSAAGKELVRIVRANDLNPRLGIVGELTKTSTVVIRLGLIPAVKSVDNLLVKRSRPWRLA